MVNKIKNCFTVKKNSTNNLRVWLMLYGVGVEDENLIVNSVIDYAHQGHSASVYVYVFLSVLKAEEVWIWDESCLVRLNHWFLGR